MAKSRSINTYIERNSLTRSDQRWLDLAWTDVRNDRGLRPALERRGTLQQLVSDDQVERRTIEPPATRAEVRSQVIGHIMRREVSGQVDWGSVNLDLTYPNDSPHATQRRMRVPFGDPRVAFVSDELQAGLDRAMAWRNRGRLWPMPRGDFRVGQSAPNIPSPDEAAGL
jgi:hypothetical protein